MTEGVRYPGVPDSESAGLPKEKVPLPSSVRSQRADKQLRRPLVEADAAEYRRCPFGHRQTIIRRKERARVKRQHVSEIRGPAARPRTLHLRSAETSERGGPMLACAPRVAPHLNHGPVDADDAARLGVLHVLRGTAEEGRESSERQASQGARTGPGVHVAGAGPGRTRAAPSRGRRTRRRSWRRARRSAAGRRSGRRHSAS